MPQLAVAPRPTLPTLLAPTPDLPFDPAADPADELRRQIDVHVALGYADLLGLQPAALTDRLAPLADIATALPADDGVPTEDHVPFVLVVAPGALAVNDRVPGLRRGARHGVSVIDEDEARTYRPVAGVEVPAGFAYLLTGVDVGARLVGVPPAKALTGIRAAGRTPLTIEEGLALVTVRPDMLRPNRCFSLAGSRTGTDKRVPAVWISDRRPKLGWCWDGNPHTWLGTASAAARVG